MISSDNLDGVRDVGHDVALRWLLDHRGLPDPLQPEQMLDGVAAAQAVLEGAQKALAAWVGAARRSGASWQTIGELLGSTRQAAQQRFGSHSPDGDAQPLLPACEEQRMVPDLRGPQTSINCTTVEHLYPYRIEHFGS